MEEKVQNEEVKEQEPQTNVDEGPGKIFDFGDVYFYCSQCGNDSLVAEAMRGISYTVPAAERAEVKMECTNCGNIIKLYFKESSEEVKELRKAEIAAQQAAAEKENEPNDGTSQEDKQEGSTQGDTSDSERIVETNEKTDGDSVSPDESGSELES